MPLHCHQFRLQVVPHWLWHCTWWLESPPQSADNHCCCCCWWQVLVFIITYQSLGGVIYGQYLADATDRFNDLPICLLVQRSVYVFVCVCVLHVCWPFNLFLLLFLNCLLCLIRLPFSRKHCLFYQQDKKGNLARQVNARTHTHTLWTHFYFYWSSLI